MAYDDDIALSQGAVKASEIFMDRANNLVGSTIGSSGVKVIEKSLDMIGTLLSKQSFVLTSTGRIEWKTASSTDAQIVFDKDAAFVPSTDLVLYVLQNENGAAQKTYKITIQGSTVASANHFKTINLANNELLYIEIKKSELQAWAAIL